MVERLCKREVLLSGTDGSKTDRMSKSRMNKMLITFFGIMGVVHFEFVPQGQTVNIAYYVQILKWLLEAVCRQRLEFWLYDWILDHDNAPAHKVLSFK
jgi:hypothetical protein